MIVGPKYTAKWSSPQYWYYLIFVSDRISHHNFWITSRFGEIRQGRNSSITRKKNLVVFALLSLEGSEFFINAFFGTLKEQMSFRLSGLLTDPHFFKMVMKVILLLGGEFFCVSTSSDDNFVDTTFFLCRIFWLDMLNRIYLYFLCCHSISTEPLLCDIFDGEWLSWLL